MALITTLSATQRNNIEVSLNRRTMRNGRTNYIVDVWLKDEDFCYTELSTSDLDTAEDKYSDLVQAVKEGWHP